MLFYYIVTCLVTIDEVRIGNWIYCTFATIARTVLEDICDKPIRIQSYCSVARLHGV
jgi:hypothetical protein